MPEESPDISKFLPAPPPAPPLPRAIVEKIPSELRLWEKLPKLGEK